MFPLICRPAVPRLVWLGMLSALACVLFLGTQRIVYITPNPSIGRLFDDNRTTQDAAVRPATAYHPTGNKSVPIINTRFQTINNTEVKPRPLVLGAKEPAPTSCPPKLHFAKDLPKTALFSPPGSGNTWVRHLLQQATGNQKPSRDAFH